MRYRNINVLKLVLIILVIFLNLIGNTFANNFDSKDKLIIEQNKIAILKKQQMQEKLINYLDAYSKFKNFHGAVLAAQKGKVLVNNSYGMADYENKIPNSTETKFAIGSMTKQFTAIAIMQLYEKGLIDINDKLSKYIPDFIGGDEITIHHLLTHTSGIIRDYTSISDNITYKSFSESIEKIKKVPICFNPGEKFQYSNTGYVVLGYIIEKVSNLKYEDYLKKHIFEPLEMQNTGIFFKGEKSRCDSYGYAGFLDLLPCDTEYEKIYQNYESACNLYSTVGDLYKWDKALHSEKFIKKQTFDLIITPYSKVSDRLGYYGYGWFINDANGNEIFHDGGTSGFTSVISDNLEKEIIIIILTNHSHFRIIDFKNSLVSIILGNNYQLPTELKEISIEQGITDIYVGTYELYPGFNIEIIKENENLFTKLPEGVILQIFAESEDRFFFRLIDAKIKFKKSVSDNSLNLILLQDGQEDLVGKKI